MMATFLGINMINYVLVVPGLDQAGDNFVRNIACIGKQAVAKPKS